MTSMYVNCLNKFIRQGLDECRHTVEGSVLKVVTNSVVVKVPFSNWAVEEGSYYLIHTNLTQNCFSTRLRRC